MTNTHRTTRSIGRAGLVALLTASTLGAQGRWEDRDQDASRTPRDSRAAYETIDTRDRRRDQERLLFTWRGVVDDDTRITIRSGRVETQLFSGVPTRSRERIERETPLPRREGTVRIQMTEGRGRVHVLQQPNAQNDYTAIVRIKDAPAGLARYTFAAYFDASDDWRRNGNGSVWGEAGSGTLPADRVRWSGSVDAGTRIVLRRGSVSYESAYGETPRSVTALGVNQIPRRASQVDIALRQGRGSVVVVQHPSSFNDYTTIVRIVDSAGGFGYYDFDLIWR